MPLPHTQIQHYSWYVAESARRLPLPRGRRCDTPRSTGTKCIRGRVTTSQIRSCIGSVVLAALEGGLGVARQPQPDLMAERDQFARPMVRSRARLDSDQARRELG